MTTLTLVTLHTCLDQVSPYEQRALKALLPEGVKEELDKISLTYPSPFSIQTENISFLEWVHPSWIAPILRQFSEKEIALFLGCFTQQQALSLQEKLLFQSPLPVLSPAGKTFLENILFKKITENSEPLFPFHLLPYSPLNILAKQPERHLFAIAELLGVRDLTTELRQIIDREKLIKVHAVLNKTQNSYLKLLMQKKEPVTFAPMGLTTWNGDSQKLKSLILQRGLNRLAKALWGQHPSLIWYIFHRFDVDKGHLLQKLCTSVGNPLIIQALSEQILDAIQHLEEFYE